MTTDPKRVTPQEEAKIKMIYDSLGSLCNAMDDLRVNHKILVNFSLGTVDGHQRVMTFQADRFETIFVGPAGNA